MEPGIPNLQDHDRGLYAVFLELPRPLVLEAGTFKGATLPPGWLVYVGSARRGLSARVLRHLRGPEKKRWHIDELTGSSRVGSRWALLLPQPRVSECGLNRRLGTLPGASTPVAGFGASDCRAHCPSHLWHLPASPSLEELEERTGRGRLLQLLVDGEGELFHRWLRPRDRAMLASPTS